LVLRYGRAFGHTPIVVIELPVDRKPGREIGKLSGARALGAYADSRWHQLGAKRYPPRWLFDHDVPV